MSIKKLSLVLLLTVMTLGSGCRLIFGTAALAVGAVAVTGYAVVQGGAAVVGLAGSAVSSGADGVQEIVYAGGRFETECPANVELAYNAAYFVFHEMKFIAIRGRQDGLSANLKARTVDGEEILLLLKMKEENTSELSIKIGKKGDLKSSQIIYDKMLGILKQEQSV